MIGLFCVPCLGRFDKTTTCIASCTDLQPPLDDQGLPVVCGHIFSTPLEIYVLYSKVAGSEYKAGR